MATPSHRQRLIDPQSGNMQQPGVSTSSFNFLGNDRQGRPSMNQLGSTGLRQPLSAISSNINGFQGGSRSTFGVGKGMSTGFDRGGRQRNGNGFGNNGYDGNMSSQSITLD